MKREGGENVRSKICDVHLPESNFKPSCRFCQDIEVFHAGGLAQRSSHDVLVNGKSGIYFSLWNMQAQYYEADNKSPP